MKYCDLGYAYLGLDSYSQDSQVAAVHDMAEFYFFEKRIWDIVPVKLFEVQVTRLMWNNKCYGFKKGVILLYLYNYFLKHPKAFIALHCATSCSKIFCGYSNDCVNFWTV